MSSHKIQTAIWQEVAHPDNPFQAEQVFCHGYDLVNDLVKNSSWIDYLFLLISGRRANQIEKILLEKISIIIANPGIRDLSVRAAMNSGVGKAPPASVLTSALNVGAGQYMGSREIALTMKLWKKNFNQEKFVLLTQEKAEKDIWPELDHIPGFDPHGTVTSAVVITSLDQFKETITDGYLNWLYTNKSQLEKLASSPISLSSVVAAAFCDLKITEEQSEYLYLILRLPGAAAHAMEQRQLGWRNFPFFSESVQLESEPEPKKLPDIQHLVQQYIK
ncbi:citryl-CoA lyase [Aliikangiella sp. IMCC44359]|uniref:citryl-CoA lyase n=1 Tax=Aliikangiella sp. IMCC44359 TaxID=3459125 RepID=UPI00403AE038